MTSATSRVTQPANRKGRKRCVNSARPPQNIACNSDTPNNITALRRQRLALFGLSNVRADLVAALAWGPLA